MRSRSRGLLVYSLATMVFAGCSGGTKPGFDATKDAGVGVGATANTCQDIRKCVASCASEVDQPCVQNCIAEGSPAAQTTYQALAACTARYCPTGDSYCGCEQHCFVDGHCLAETEACVAGVADLVCEMFCH